jgi:hypothetical protein
LPRVSVSVWVRVVKVRVRIIRVRISWVRVWVRVIIRVRVRIEVRAMCRGSGIGFVARREVLLVMH